jgi:hypothetical protein
VRTCIFKDRRAQDRCTECGETLALCLCPAPDEQAARRITSNEGLFLRRVRDELNLADERAETNQFLLEKLTAQVGHLNERIVSHHDGQGANAESIMQTLIQTAVLVTRIATEGDSDFSFSPVTVFGEDNPTR